MRRMVVLVMTLMVVLLVPRLGTQSLSPDAAAKRVVGMWRLVSITHDDGTEPPNRGPRPTGLIGRCQ